MHEGHRERLRERYICSGIDGFADHEVLELLLTYAIPRRNTNDIAHDLLACFGSLNAVFSAEVAELTTVRGVGESTAVFLHLLSDCARLHARQAKKDNERSRLASPVIAAAFALDLLGGERYESVYVVSLDKNMRLLHAERVLSGTLTEAPLYPRRIVESALMHRAHAVLLLHNHPSGDPSPSESDARATEAVKVALNSIDIRLFDHIIVGHGVVYSFSRGILIKPGHCAQGQPLCTALAPPQPEDDTIAAEKQ